MMWRIVIMLTVVGAAAGASVQGPARPAPAVDGGAPEGGGVVGTMDEGPPPGPRGFGDLLGRYHPALVHFPIAWLLLLALTDFMGLVLRREEWVRWGAYLIVLLVVSLVPTMATGLLRAGHMNPDEITAHQIVIHRTLNFIMASLVFVALGVRFGRRRALAGGARVIYLALIGAAVVLVIFSASYGGRIVYGPDFVPF